MMQNIKMHSNDVIWCKRETCLYRRLRIEYLILNDAMAPKIGECLNVRGHAVQLTLRGAMRTGQLLYKRLSYRSVPFHLLLKLTPMR